MLHHRCGRRGCGAHLPLRASAIGEGRTATGRNPTPQPAPSQWRPSLAPVYHWSPARPRLRTPIPLVARLAPPFYTATHWWKEAELSQWLRGSLIARGAIGCAGVTRVRQSRGRQLASRLSAQKVVVSRAPPIFFHSQGKIAFFFCCCYLEIGDQCGTVS